MGPVEHGHRGVGASWDGGGVIGEGGSIQKDPEERDAGPGVIGIAPGDVPGVLAQSMTMETRVLDGGLALDVVGKARFSTAGSGTVLAGQESVLVTDAAATADSHIMVTLVGDPGARSVRWVSRTAGAFTVHLTSAPANKRPATPFTYLIVEPG